MVTLQGLVIFVTIMMAEVAVCRGFWYTSSNTPKKMGPPPMQGYTTRSEGFNPWAAALPYQNEGVTVALPVAVPVHPQAAPPPPTMQGTLHNVKLVPCLCPISNSLVNEDYISMSQQHQQPQQSGGYSPMQQQPASSISNP